MLLLVSKRYSCSSPPCAFLKLRQTLPSAIEKHRKAKTSGSRSTPSTHLLEDSDDLHYHSIGDTAQHRHDSLTESGNSMGTEPPPLRTLLFMPRVLITVINCGFLGFCEMSVTALTPLMWSTSLENGGLGFTPYRIGIAFAVYGLFSTFFQAIAVGKVVRHFGPRKVLIGSMVPWLVLFSCFPLERYFARSAGQVDWRVWSVITVHLVMYCMATASYSKLNFLQTLANTFNIYCQARYRF